MKRVFIIAAAVAIGASCAKEESATADDRVDVTFKVTADGTRVALDENSTDDEWKFVWEESDTMEGISADDTTTPTFSISSFSQYAPTFSGTMVDGGEYRLFYPSSTINITPQDGTLNKTYLMSENAINSNNIADGVDLKHLGAFLNLNINLNKESLDGYDLYVFAVGVLGVNAPISANVPSSYTDELDVTGTGNIIIYTDNIPIKYGDTISVPVNILPFSVASGTDFIFQMYFKTDPDNTTYYILQCTKNYTSDTGAELVFNRATVNNITVVYDNFSYMTSM